MNSAELDLKKRFSAKFVLFSAKFGSLNVQIKNTINKVTFIAYTRFFFTKSVHPKFQNSQKKIFSKFGHQSGICPWTGTQRHQSHHVCSDLFTILTDQSHIAKLLWVLHIFNFLAWIFQTKNPSLVIPQCCFNDLCTKHLTGSFYFYFSISSNNLVFSISAKNNHTLS